jgi:hypothetical protein
MAFFVVAKLWSAAARRRFGMRYVGSPLQIPKGKAVSSHRTPKNKDRSQSATEKAILRLLTFY